MAQISIVWKSQLEGKMRLDAEYYMPKYINALSVVQKWGSVCQLGQIAKVLRGKNPKAYTENGIPIIRAIDLRDITNTDDFLHADFNEDLFFLKQDDILISSIGEGSIGKVEIFRDTVQCATVSEVSVIRCSGYNPYALATFLRSKYGYLQLERRITGSTGQLHLYPKDIATVLVPSLPLSFQQVIEDMVAESDRRSRQSKTLYFEAEQLLLDEIGFKDLDLSHQLYYIVPFKKTVEAKRLDAEYFQPKYEHAMALIGKSGLRIEDVAKLSKERFKPELGQPFDYIEISDLSANGQIDSQRLMGEDAPSRATWLVRPNDVITSTVRPIRRLSALIGPEQDGFVCSSGFAVLRPSAIEPEVLLVFLRLPLICEILDLKTSASMYPAISSTDLMKMPMSLPRTEIRQKIVELVRSARSARQKARQLLEEAKHKVEEMVEKG
ncbi:MAG: hypothetical protein HYX92_02345 [Chloroflexi bacterium]|nr:hypothetical protein [Chloroflexota bacterium]